MNWKPASRIQAVQTPVIPLVGEWLAATPGAISLGQGIVHYSPPPRVMEAAAAGCHEMATHRYASVRGIDPMIKAIERKLATENDIDLRQSSIVVTAGSNMGFMNAVFAIADAGDEVILLSPYYFNHEMAIEMAGCKTVAVATDANCQVDLAALESAITPRTRAIVTVSPNNPTGAVYPADVLRRINTLCRERGIFHISDEAYEYFSYDAEHFSPASMTEVGTHTISLFSLSKAFGMAGWRVGYMVIPKELETAVKKAQDTNLVCPPIISQLAGVAALDAGRAWCQERSQEFVEVRDLVLEQLGRLGDRVQIPHPSGAFYVLVHTASQRPDLELVETLIRDYGVAVLPGSTFGIQRRCSLRVAYGALEKDMVAGGIERLTRGLEALL